MTTVSPETAQEIFGSMENIASMLLPHFSDDIVESQLATFDMFLGLMGGDWRDRTAGLLRHVAGLCSELSRKERLLQAAGCVAKGEPCARTAAAQANTPETPLPQLAPEMPPLGLRDLFSRQTVRIGESFVDGRGQTIKAGEILQFELLDYLPGDGSFTIQFAETQVRLSERNPDDARVIANEGNRYFEPVPNPRSLKRCAGLIGREWRQLNLVGVSHADEIADEIDRCRAWLKSTGDRGPAPLCVTAPLAQAAFPGNSGKLDGLAWRITFLFAGIQVCTEARQPGQ
jgi:hypothetical protein